MVLLLQCPGSSLGSCYKGRNFWLCYTCGRVHVLAWCSEDNCDSWFSFTVWVSGITVRQPWPQASLPIDPSHQPETSAVGPCHPGLQVFAYVNLRWGSVLSWKQWKLKTPYQAPLKCSEHVCESAVVHTANVPSITGIITSPGQQLKEQFLLNPSCFLSIVISLSHTCKEPSVFNNGWICHGLFSDVLKTWFTQLLDLMTTATAKVWRSRSIKVVQSLSLSP